MGILDKINKWRGFYDETVEPQCEYASFPVKFDSFESFAGPFARSMSMEIFREMGNSKVIEDSVPFVLWGDRPASNEYVYIFRSDMLDDEKLEAFEKAQDEFVETIDPNYRAVVISLVCVEKGSEAFRRYCEREPRMNGFELAELVVGIDFSEKLMHTCVLSNCPGEKNAKNLRKEFLRMIRAAENCFLNGYRDAT